MPAIVTRRLQIATTLLVLAGVAYVNLRQLWEAFGPGPPYYGRTVNLDKWESPILSLLLIDAVAAIVVTVLLYPVLRRHAAHPGAADRVSRHR